MVYKSSSQISQKAKEEIDITNKKRVNVHNTMICLMKHNDIFGELLRLGGQVQSSTLSQNLTETIIVLNQILPPLQKLFVSDS